MSGVVLCTLRFAYPQAGVTLLGVGDTGVVEGGPVEVGDGK